MGFMKKRVFKEEIGDLLRVMLLIFVAPVIGTFLYFVPLAAEPQTDNYHLCTSVLLTLAESVISVSISHTLNYVFADVPFGSHTLILGMFEWILLSSWSLFLRFVFGVVIPFEFLILAILNMPITQIVLTLKIIPVFDTRNQIFQYWNIGSWLHFPKDMRFDVTKRYQVKQLNKATFMTYLFCLMYPILGGIFSHASVVVQACLVSLICDLSSLCTQMGTLNNIYHRYLCSTCSEYLLRFARIASSTITLARIRFQL
jgi:hypothetical protein